ncbi:signal peptidase II [Candidatus Thioglobus sp.]|uniref:signal peptidase II n=1 Tax=Candidatus Thioglobus sp. TaxID=2026721 RepID=UPI003D0E4845
MKHIKWYFLVLLLIMADQLTKQWVYVSMSLYESFAVTSFLSITHAHNPGAAFSFLANQDGWQQYFLVLISVIASLAIIIWMTKTSRLQSLKLAALSLILSGAVGNLIDRALFGFVIDFIDLHYQNFYWPVFNIADSIIIIGAILLIIADLKQNKKPANE